MANDTPELKDAAEQILFWVRLISSTLALALLLFGRRWILIHLAAFRLALKRMDEVDVRDGKFVTRSHKQEELLTALKSENYETVFVYGPRGSGKSCLIQHALKGRRGVLEIKISEKTHEDASIELIQKLSTQVDCFGREQNQLFVEDVFAACRVPPIVVVALEHRCNGEVLEAVLIMCKILSYESRTKAVRFVVHLSGSRAAIDSSIQLTDLRCVGVHIGNFSDSEALIYASERVPTTFKDENRRNQIAEHVVRVFDGKVLLLQRVCKLLREGYPGDIDDVNRRIEQEKESEVRKATNGWREFCKFLANVLDNIYDAAAVKEMAVRLLKEPQPVDEIITLLSHKSDKEPLSPRDIGLFNADAGYHPFSIDPFETTVSLSGKAIKAVLCKKYK